MPRRPPTRPRLARRRLCVAVVAMAGVGCEAPRGPVSIDSDDPDLHVLAIKRAVAEHDDSVDPKLIGDLDDRDPAVRFYAIQGLRRLTGDNFGYRYFDDDDARRPAVQRWRAWVAAHPSRP